MSFVEKWKKVLEGLSGIRLHNHLIMEDLLEEMNISLQKKLKEDKKIRDEGE